MICRRKEPTCTSLVLAVLIERPEARALRDWLTRALPEAP